MSIATVVTRGFGTFGTVNFLPTLGYTPSTTPTPTPPPPRVGGHGREDDDGTYSEPRRVIIGGKPYTVYSKAQYLGLLARARRDQDGVAQAEAAIERSQDAAREALQEKQVEEIASLMQAVIAKEAAKFEKTKKKKEPALAEADIPIEVLMLIGQEI